MTKLFTLTSRTSLAGLRAQTLLMKSEYGKSGQFQEAFVSSMWRQGGV